MGMELGILMFYVVELCVGVLILNTHTFKILNTMYCEIYLRHFTKRHTLDFSLSTLFFPVGNFVHGEKRRGDIFNLI